MSDRKAGKKKRRIEWFLSDEEVDLLKAEAARRNQQEDRVYTRWTWQEVFATAASSDLRDRKILPPLT